MKFMKLILILATCLIAALSLGQGRGMFRNGQMGQPGSLLGRTDVQTDLALTADQKAKIDAINTDYRGQMREIFQNANGDFAAARKQMAPLMEKQQAEQMKVLTADQVTRLTQISIQLWSYGALLSKDLQTQLGLSDSEKAKIESLNQAMQDANASVFQKAQNNEIDRSEIGPTMQKNSDALKASIGGVLTDAEKAKFTSMAGKTFTPDPPPSGGR